MAQPSGLWKEQPSHLTRTVKEQAGHLHTYPRNATPSSVFCCAMTYRQGDRCLVGAAGISQRPRKLNLR